MFVFVPGKGNGRYWRTELHHGTPNWAIVGTRDGHRGRGAVRNNIFRGRGTVDFYWLSICIHEKPMNLRWSQDENNSLITHNILGIKPQMRFSQFHFLERICRFCFRNQFRTPFTDVRCNFSTLPSKSEVLIKSKRSVTMTLLSRKRLVKILMRFSLTIRFCSSKQDRLFSFAWKQQERWMFHGINLQFLKIAVL